MPRTPSPLSLEFILLGFLHLQPAHGYELYKKLSAPEGAAMVWRIKQPQLYALLDRLERDQLIAARLVPGEARPDRREYAITPAGQARFETWRCAPVMRFRGMRQEFMAKLYFASLAGKKPARQLLEAQEEVCLAWIDGLQVRLNEVDKKDRFERMLLGFRLAQARTTLAWLGQCRTEFDA